MSFRRYRLQGKVHTDLTVAQCEWTGSHGSVRFQLANETKAGDLTARRDFACSSSGQGKYERGHGGITQQEPWEEKRNFGVDARLL